VLRRMSVSLVVCLFVCFCPSVHSTILKTYVQISPNFLYTLPMAVARSSSYRNAICYVLPVLWMTCFRMIEQMGQNQRRHVVSSSSPGGGTEVYILGGMICHSSLLHSKIALSRVAGGSCHKAATPLVDHGEQRPQSSQRPHDGGVRRTKSGGCLRSELTDGRPD